MKLFWDEQAWEDYLYWQQTNKSLVKRINNLIKAISRQPFNGIGNPEPLRHAFSGYWSRRINKEHRLVYAVEGKTIRIAQCRYHYGT